MIDDDLGRSGGGIARPGFEKLIAAVGRGSVGAVFAVEASRLARNGRDWHTLLEFCGFVGARSLMRTEFMTRVHRTTGSCSV